MDFAAGALHFGDQGVLAVGGDAEGAVEWHGAQPDGAGNFFAHCGRIWGFGGDSASRIGLCEAQHGNRGPKPA